LVLGQAPLIEEVGHEELGRAGKKLPGHAPNGTFLGFLPLHQRQVSVGSALGLVADVPFLLQRPQRIVRTVV